MEAITTQSASPSPPSPVHRSLLLMDSATTSQSGEWVLVGVKTLSGSTDGRQTTATFSYFKSIDHAPTFSLVVKEQNKKDDITYTNIVALNHKEAEFLVAEKGDKMDLATRDGHVYRSLAAYVKKRGNIPFWLITQQVKGRKERCVSVPVWKRDELLGIIRSALNHFKKRIGVGTISD